jgi:ribonuclease HI
LKDQTLILQFDGGSRGNPGPAGVGIVIGAEDGTPLVTIGRFIGRATNNVAEYRALIAVMQEAQKLGARRVIIRGDSELIVRQMNGEYRVKNADLKPLWRQAQDLQAEFEEARIEHNLRHHNEVADRLANLAIDRRAEVTDADLPAGGVEAGGDQDADEAAGGDTKAGADQTKWRCPRCNGAIKVVVPPARGTRPFLCRCGTPMRKEP